MKPVVTRILLEPPAGEEYCDLRLILPEDSSQAAGVGPHVGLADDRDAHARLAQDVAEGFDADGEWDFVPCRAMARHIAAGIERHAGRPACRRLHISARKARSLRRQAVDVRRPDGASETPDIVSAQLIAHDEKDVPDGH